MFPSLTNCRIRIYWNIRKKCYSMLNPETGRVIGHASNVYLRDARFIVNAAGRDRVRSERRKNVHAFVDGRLTEPPLTALERFMPIRVNYNPYRDDGFVANPVDAPWFPNHTVTDAWHVAGITDRRGRPVIRAGGII
jgi:hypothetical protein